MTPTCSSDSTRRRRSKTATWVGGQERGRARPARRRRRGQRARLGEGEVDAGHPEIGAGRLGSVPLARRLRRRSPGHRHRREARARRAPARGRSRALAASHVTMSRATRSRAMARSTRGTSARRRHAVEHAGHALELLRKRVEGLGPALGHLRAAPPRRPPPDAAGARPWRAAKRPGVFVDLGRGSGRGTPRAWSSPADVLPALA